MSKGWRTLYQGPRGDFAVYQTPDGYVVRGMKGRRPGNPVGEPCRFEESANRIARREAGLPWGGE